MDLRGYEMAQAGRISKSLGYIPHIRMQVDTYVLLLVVVISTKEVLD